MSVNLFSINLSKILLIEQRLEIDYLNGGDKAEQQILWNTVDAA